MIESLYNRPHYVMAQALMDKCVRVQEAVASNVANIETPGYKRVELKSGFEKELTQWMESSDPSLKSGVIAELAVDQESPAVRPDGNNVNLETELLTMNRNALEYEFLTKYVGHSFSSIRMAITGNSSSSR
jgi:flagellar basal-body rod protein FlgB